MGGKETRRNEHQTDGCYPLQTSVKNIMGCIGSRTISKNIPHYFPPCVVVKRSVCLSCSRVEVCREGEMRGSLQGCTIIFTFLQIVPGVLLLHVSCLSFISNFHNCACVCLCVCWKQRGRTDKHNGCDQNKIFLFLTLRTHQALSVRRHLA